MKNKDKGVNQSKKKWLASYGELMEEVESETRLAGYWQEKAFGLSPPVLSFSPSKSANNRGMADYVAEFLDIARRCSELADQADKKKHEILEAINKLENPDYRQLLKMHYIEGKNFRIIAETMHFSIDWIKRLHFRALSVIEVPEEYTRIHSTK